jgi:purine-cytosine permease-like protein
MSDDDEAPEGTESESTSDDPGVRRSTYTPPPAGPDGEAALDDDALADALAADLGRLMTGTIPIVASGSYPDLADALEAPLAETERAEPEPAESAEPAEPEPAEPDAARPEVASDSEPPVVPEATELPPPTAYPPSVPAENPPVDSEPAEPTEPPASLEDTVSAAAPWMSFPPPDPAQAVDLGEVPPEPVRSAADEQFDALLSGAPPQPQSTLDRIEALEAQLRMRDAEAHGLSDWDERMRSLEPQDGAGADDAGVPPPPPAPETGPFTVPEAPIAEWPVPRAEDAAEGKPPPETDVPPSLPAWDVPPPSPTWAPGPEFGVDAQVEAAPVDAGPPPPLVTELPDFARIPPPVPPSWEPRPWEPHLPDQFAGDAAPHELPDPDALVEDTVVPDASPAPTESAAENGAIPPIIGLPPIALPEIVFPDETFAEPIETPPVEAPPLVEPPVRMSRRAQRLPWFAQSPEETGAADTDTETTDTEVTDTEVAVTETTDPETTDPNVPETSAGETALSPDDRGVVERADAPGPELFVEAPAPDTSSVTDADPFPWALTPRSGATPDPEPTPEPAEVEPDPVPTELADSVEQPLTPAEPTPFGVLPFGVRPLDEYTPPTPAWEPVTEATIEPDEVAEVTDIVVESGVDVPDVDVSDVDPAVDEPDIVDESPLPNSGERMFSPPPLVEPQRWGGPPVNPSDVGSDALPSALPDEEPPRSNPAEPDDGPPEGLFIEPLPVAAGEPVPSDTGSITVIDQAYEEELADDVDETDRAFADMLGPLAVSAAGVAALPTPVAAPSGPIATTRIPEDEPVFFTDEPSRARVFSLEASGPEPTPVDYRAGRAARLFWLWFAANSSVLSVGLGAIVFAVGMSLRQSIVSVLAGVALSFIPLGLTTLAGKRSGQPTMIVSRATFGVVGNVVPAALALLTRLFWGAVLLWLLGSSIAIILVGAEFTGSLGETQVLLISLAAGFLIALLIAFAGYPLLARIQLILSIVSGILVVGLIAMTARYINIPAALTVSDGPWLMTITGAVLVFSFVGLVWAQSGADLARYQRPGSSGATSMLWATFGTTLPSFLLIGYGALLAASDESIATGFATAPLDTLAAMLPSWYPVPLLAATALSLLSGITIALYSGGFALQSLGVRLKRQWSIVIVGVLLGALALVITFGGVGGIDVLFRDGATSLAVPTAAWAGIFAAETMIRNRRFESQSLLSRGGIYGDVRWVNLVGLIAISAIGFALTTASVGWLSWQGFGFVLLGIPVSDPLAATDVGVLVALVLGLLLPIVAGIPSIRKQEATEV